VPQFQNALFAVFMSSFSPILVTEQSQILAKDIIKQTNSPADLHKPTTIANSRDWNFSYFF
jgi:hypothetical protein